MTKDQYEMAMLAYKAGAIYKRHKPHITDMAVLTSQLFDEGTGGIARIYRIRIENFIPLFNRWLLGFRT